MTGRFNPKDLTALVPAAGRATRVSELPFSKSLYPLPIGRDEVRVVTPIGRLLESLRLAHVGKAIVVNQLSAQDLMGYVGRDAHGLNLAHVITDPTPSVPHTICKAVPFLGSCGAVLCFPDIVFRPEDSLRQLLAFSSHSRADVVLGLFPTDTPEKVDTVELDEEGVVVRIAVKSISELDYAWVFAVWSARFSSFLYDYVQARASAPSPVERELQLAEIFSSARDHGLIVRGKRFPAGRFLDLGTADALSTAPRFLEQ